MEIEAKIIKNFDLKNLTTFKIGGLARFFVEIKTKEELTAISAWVKKQNLAVFFLGGGSNILVSDDGFSGLVIKLSNQDLELETNNLTCDAGASLVRALKISSNKGLSGLEWVIGIPGITVGGAIRGNAGAFGDSMNRVIEAVQVYDFSRDKWTWFKNQECQFAYRESIFKQEKSLVIWQAQLKLEPKDKASIKKTIQENLDKRLKDQPQEPSAGSVFKNFTFEYLKTRNSDLASRAQKAGVVKGGKVGAGWVIDHLDLSGKTIGGAQISTKHANFIINTGEATALDVITLLSYIKQKVRQKSNLQLQEEIEYLGF